MWVSAVEGCLLATTVSGSIFRQCFVSACPDDPDCECCLLFSSSVFQKAGVPLHFALLMYLAFQLSADVSQGPKSLKGPHITRVLGPSRPHITSVLGPVTFIWTPLKLVPPGEVERWTIAGKVHCDYCCLGKGLYSLKERDGNQA